MSMRQFYYSIVPALRMDYHPLLMISSAGGEFYETLLKRKDTATGKSPFMVSIVNTTCAVCIALVHEERCDHVFALKQRHWLGKDADSVLKVFYGEDQKHIYQAEIANMPVEDGRVCFMPQQIAALTHADDGGTLATLSMSISLRVPEVVIAVDPALGGTDHMGVCAVYMWGEDLVIVALDSNKLDAASYENDETALLFSNMRALRALPHLSSSRFYFVCERTGNAEVYHLNARLREKERELGPLDYHHTKTKRGETPGFWTDNAGKMRLLACMRAWMSSGHLRLDTRAVSANPWLAQENALMNEDRLQRARRSLVMQAERARFIVNVSSKGHETISWSGKVDSRGVRRADYHDDTLLAFAMGAYVASERTRGSTADARGV